MPESSYKYIKISGDQLYVKCPGCDLLHEFNVVPGIGKPLWTFNNDFEKPTFSPSLVYRYKMDGKSIVCHSFVENGCWRFLNDCTHELAGKTVPMLLF